MALNLESINIALKEAFGRTINLKEKAFENDDVSDNKFEGIEDDFCIFSGNESLPLRLMISKIREQEGFTEKSDKLIEDMLSRAAKPGGGLHFYEKGEGESPTYTPKIVSVEEDELGRTAAAQATVEHFKSLTPPPESEPYQRSKFALFFKKLFKSKNKKAQLQRKYDQYQANKASYEDSLRLTDEAVNKGKSLRETNGLKENEKARFKEMLPEVKKEKAIAEKRNKAAFEKQENERKEREKEELEDNAKENISKIASDNTYNIFKNNKLFSSAAASAKLGINEPKLDKKIEDYKDQLLEEFGPKQTDIIIATFGKNMHALRFGCVMQELLKDGTALNKALGTPPLHLPLSLINADLGKEVDDEVKQVMGEVCKVAAEKSDEIIKTLIEDSEKGVKMVALATSYGAQLGTAILKGMPPEEVKNNPAQFMETANLIKSSLEYADLTGHVNLSKNNLPLAFGFAEIAAIAERAENSKEDNCRKLKAAIDKDDGDEQHFKDCATALSQIASGYSAPQLMQEYFAKSQQMNIEGNEECKQIMKNAQVQEKSTKSLAITMASLSSALPINKDITDLGNLAIQENVSPKFISDRFDSMLLEGVIENKQQLMEGIDKLANKKATLATNKSSISEGFQAGLEKQAAAIKEAQQKSQEKALPQINNPDANKEHSQNAEMAK